MTMATESMLITTHKNVKISYTEDSNKWEFDLRGRHYIKDSVRECRVIIDKPAPVSKKSSFEPVEAYIYDRYCSSVGKFQKIRVTSVAAREYPNDSPACWTVDKQGTLSKNGVHNLFQITGQNDILIDEHRSLDRKIKEAALRQRTIIEKLLVKIVLPTEEH
jgi:hypothetical protein